MTTGETVAVSVTFLANPLMLVRVMVTVPALPWTMLMLVDEAEIVKSCTVKLMLVEWDNEPLVPVTITV